METKRVGLVVGRLQPFHAGHSNIINRMIEECETAIVCIGSAQKSREKHDPWTIEERMEMLKNVYGAFSNNGEYLGSRIKIIPLVDIGAATPQQWVDYIIEKIKKLGLGEPTDYFTGSEFDATWFRDHFASDWRALESHYYNTTNTTNSQPTVIGDSYSRYVTEDGIFRRLHIFERQEMRVPSATELRGFMELRTDGWKKWVPNVNHELVLKNYPEELKIPLEGKAKKVSKKRVIRGGPGYAAPKPKPPSTRLVREGYLSPPRRGGGGISTEQKGY